MAFFISDRHVLALPTAYQVVHAGEWNEDHAREHWLYEGEVEVRFQSGGVGDPPDLLVRVDGGQEVRHLRRVKSAAAYRCSR